MQKRTYKILDLVFIFTSLCLVGFLFWQFGSDSTTWFSSEKTEEKSAEKKPAYIDKLTGIGTDNFEDSNPVPLAIMIDNHPEAFPISGLNEAKVIYEAPVEGNMTRFMAIFAQNQTANKVGPVRSARPDYLDWAQEYGIPLYMHCGGSPDALSRLKTERGLIDFNEFYNGSYFWRDSTRLAPHNLYTSSSLWQSAWEKYGKESFWQSFTFGQNNSTTPAVEIEVAYSGNFKVGWKYNYLKKNYERYFRGEKFLDDKNDPIFAQTIIIVKNKTKVLDEVGRLSIYNIGSGDAYILSGGRMIKGQWRKSKAEFRTRFYDDFGAELSVPPGKIWFMSVPTEKEITIN
ncbi:MAG TPA: DUF3048 domain-containing protein [Candidatus Magasanikbacteria bacterium]|nr:DUF3048 domain-containing protein [Candidatus Magasanikbacteria bacterium]